MGIKDDMSKMFKALTGGEENSEELATDAPTTLTVVTDAPVTSAPDEFETIPPSTDAPVTSVPTTDIPLDDTSLKAEIERLKNDLSDLRSGKTVTSAPSTDAPISDENWVEGIDLDDLSRDPDAFNKLLNSVYKKGIKAARETAKEVSIKSLSSLPDMVKNNMSVLQVLEKASNDFYDKNKELEPYKDVVATIFGEVAKSNPDKTYVENLDIVGEEVRKRLGLKKGDVINRDVPPKLPGNKGNSRPNVKSELTGFESELDAMDKALNS